MSGIRLSTESYVSFAVPFSSLIGKTVYGFLAGDERVTEGQNG